MVHTIFVESANGPKYGLSVGWTDLAFSRTSGKSLYPFCLGESMRHYWGIYNQDADKSWGWGNFSFVGTALSLIGTVDFAIFPTDRSLSYSVDTIGSTIDGSGIQLHNLTTTYPAHVYEFYKTGPLPDGQHLLNLTRIPPGVMWDWATITPGPDMPIKGETLVVDDTDELIVYTGNWEQTQEAFLVGGVPKRNFTYYHSGYGGGVHVAHTVNDTLQFPFTGTSVSVYGFFRWDVPGTISATFQIDNMQADQLSFPIAPNRVIQNQTIFQVHTEPNFMFYKSPPIAAGNHVLTIKIMEVNGEQSFIIDTLQYLASFDTLSSMPHIAVPPLNSEPPSSDPSIRGNRTRTIVGGVIGGVLVLVILVLIGIWLRRRRLRRDEELSTAPEPFLAEKTHRPPDIPPDVLVFNEVAPPIPSKRRNVEPSIFPASAAIPVDLTSLEAAVSPLGLSGAQQGSLEEGEGGEEDERRMEELERAVQREAREHEFLIYGQADPPAYIDGHS